MDSNAIIRQHLEPAINTWFTEQCADNFAAYYFYYKPTTADSDGALTIATDPPGADWMLASADRVSPFWTKQNVYTHCHQIARRLPFLPLEGR